jgi:hypothetical protein
MKTRVLKQLKQVAFLGAAIFLAAQIYAFRELFLLAILFSVAFWLVAGMVVVGLVIFEGVEVGLAWTGSHLTSSGRFRLEPSLASTQTVRVSQGKRIVE